MEFVWEGKCCTFEKILQPLSILKTGKRMIQILCKQIERGNHKKMSFTLVATNSMLATGTIQFQNNITAVLKTYSSLKLRSNSHTQIINYAKLCCFVFTHIGKVVKKTNFCS